MSPTALTATIAATTRPFGRRMATPSADFTGLVSDRDRVLGAADLADGGAGAGADFAFGDRRRVAAAAAL